MISLSSQRVPLRDSDFQSSKVYSNNSGDIGLWSQYDRESSTIEPNENEVLSYAPDHYMILEHLGSNDEEIVLADNGFMLWEILTISMLRQLWATPVTCLMGSIMRVRGHNSIEPIWSLMMRVNV